MANPGVIVLQVEITSPVMKAELHVADPVQGLGGMTIGMTGHLIEAIAPGMRVVDLPTEVLEVMGCQDLDVTKINLARGPQRGGTEIHMTENRGERLITTLTRGMKTGPIDQTGE